MEPLEEMLPYAHRIGEVFTPGVILAILLGCITMASGYLAIIGSFPSLQQRKGSVLVFTALVGGGLTIVMLKYPAVLVLGVVILCFLGLGMILAGILSVKRKLGGR